LIKFYSVSTEGIDSSVFTEFNSNYLCHIFLLFNGL
jgi:hypothetical protein